MSSTPASDIDASIQSADGADVSEPIASPGRGRRSARVAAAAAVTVTVTTANHAEEATTDIPMTKKRSRAKSVAKSESAPPATSDADPAPEPVAKKGRAKSVVRQTSAASSQEDAEDAGEGVSTPSSIAAAVLEIERAKRASLPADASTIMCWNVNGLRAALRSGADQYFNQADADIVVLCEVKADDDVVRREFANAGEPAEVVAAAAKRGSIAAAFAGTSKSSSTASKKYHKYWNCATKKGYSGTALWSKVKPLSVVNGIGLASHDSEGRCITAEYDDFFLVVTYVPNSGQKLDRLSYRTTEWDLALLAYLQKLETQKPVIWTGDLNVAHHDCDIHSPGTSHKFAGFTPAERANFDATVNKHGFVDVFHHLYPSPSPHRFTYWGYRNNMRATNRGWRLDYFVVSPRLLESRTLDTWIGSELTEGDRGKRRSDHAPIFLSMHKNATTNDSE